MHFCLYFSKKRYYFTPGSTLQFFLCSHFSWVYFLIRIDEIDPDVTYMDSPLQMNPGNFQLKQTVVYLFQLQKIGYKVCFRGLFLQKIYHLH